MAARADAYAHLVRDLGLEAPHGSRLVLSGTWGAELPSTGEPGLYIVREGRAYLRAAGGPLIGLDAGDAAILPQGARHALLSDPRAATPPFEAFVAEHGGGRGVDLVAGRRGPEAHIETLCFRVGGANARALLGVVPDVLVLRAREGSAWVSHVTRALSALIRAGEASYGTVPAALTEVLLAVALRDVLRGPVAMGSADDAKVRTARAFVHAAPAAPWTVARMARSVGLSTSTFHERFARAVGMAPMEYVTQARMRHASDLLAKTEASVQEVAEAVGYQSASSFAVAFRRWSGETPTEARARRRRRA